MHYKKIDYVMHVRLSKIIKSTELLTKEEKDYVMHPWTHIDFLFYNKVTKERLFVVEIDGIQYHEQNLKQTDHDAIKDKALSQNGVSIYRFKTNESNEQDRLCRILDEYTY
ncbi:MAG TPA: hypothetical protein DEA45_03030 [Acholeplasmataceae bacterium]|nr:hypothetical protein [Acholeplasmataceae bacterium]